MENTTVSEGEKPKKKMPMWKKILIGIGVFIIVVIILAFSATSGIVKVAEKQLNLIASGDLKGAYALTSQEFQRSVSYDKFMAYVNNYEVLKNYKGHTFTSRETQGDTGTIKGTLTAKDGTAAPVEYKFIKEKGEWKILSVDLSSTGGTNTNTKANTSASTNTSGNMQTFSDSALGYAIQYPKDWTVEKKDSVTVLFSGPKEKDMFDVTLNIQNLASTNRGGKYADNNDVVKDLKNQIKSIDKNATFSDATDITFKRTDGMELTAKSFATKFVNQGKNFAIMQIVVPHGDSLTFHAIGYTAPIEKFEKYLDLVQSILETFTISK
ncbi:MAG: DUF4864 domain-containing protein [Candidatus Moranbacteria bacterium]|nr:DUF4864 domain-containing protein [Candidatus Moranbacteria bacterium]